MSENVNHVVPKLFDSTGKFACQLFVGRSQCEVGLGVNDVRHRLGLGEVDAAVEEGAFGKFAGISQTSPGSEDRVEDEFGGNHAAMAGDLNHVFAGEGARRSEHGEEHFVDFGACLDDVTVVHGVGGSSGWFAGTGAEGCKTLIRYGEGFGPGDPDDREPGFTDCGGDGGDRIVDHSSAGV